VNASTSVEPDDESATAEPATDVSREELDLRRRLLGEPLTAKAKLWGWIGPLIVTVLAGFLRLWDLGRPHQLVFDETYYVKQGWSMMLYGHERKVPENMPEPDAFFTHNQVATVYGPEPDFIVHPPFGKWVIGAGEHLFGITSSFGWRISVALAGTLAVLLVGRAAWHLFRSATLATIAAILTAFEGMEFVMSRTSVLDGLVSFWALAAFVAILADRDRTRRLLAHKVATLKNDGTWDGDDKIGHRLRLGGPSLGLRPWRWVAAVCLGLGMATKWSDGFYLVALGLVSVFWDLGARRAIGARRWFSSTIVKDGFTGALIMVPVVCLTYLVTWAGWLRSTDGWGRHWAEQNPATKDTGFSPDSSLFGWMPDALRSLWQYHIQMYDSAKSITSPHTYQSNPWTWMAQTRPTSFFYESPARGVEGCGVNECSKAITSLGNVSIWWAGIGAILVCLFMWALRRDWRPGVLLALIAAGWLPWFGYQERTIFTFYAVVFAPYVILAVTYCLGLILGPAHASLKRRRIGAGVVGAYVVLAVGVFIFFWPIYTAQVIPHSHWSWRMWLPSWI
jgi:dolichyl-phosphate-mannose--protein O-mannosyl transferase